MSCLEKQQSVMVAAHTSAGKTAVAEYAIAMALRDNQRVVVCVEKIPTRTSSSLSLSSLLKDTPSR